MTDKPFNLAQQVAEDIKSMGPDVHQEVVDWLVNREKRKRVEAIAQCYDKWLKFQGEIKKASRPDQIQVDATGKETSSSFSKKAYEALKTLREKSEKIEKAVEKAINGDVGDAYNIAKDKGDGGSSNSEGADSSAS